MSRRLIDMHEGDLRQLVADAVAEQLDALRAVPAPALDDIKTMSKALRISTKTLQRLRAEPGFPEHRLGDAPRFDRAEVVAWIKARSGAQGLRIVEGGKR